MTEKRIFFVVYPGFELLDLSGPMAVFATANTLSNAQLYDLKTLSTQKSLVISSAGVSIKAQQLGEYRCDSETTFLVVGAQSTYLKRAIQDTALIAWLTEQSSYANRYGSVCTGAFVLQTSGLLDGKTVTTHWAGCDQLRKLNADGTVLHEALYHVDGKCWTSAGVTTGIDMALEMVKRDHGVELMQMIAKYLVVYTQRPGKQSQFAIVHHDDANEEDKFAKLINWLKTEIMRPIKVGEMAEYMCMSERSFQRKFTANYSIPPSRYFERMRMEYARDYLLPRHSVDRVSSILGYASVSAFRTSFQKQFGLLPSLSKKMR